MKQNYHHPDLKTALIEKTIELLETQSYESITIRGLTDLLGVSRTAVYRHFSSREALFKAVIFEGFEKLKTELKKVYTNNALTIREKIQKIVQSYIDYALKHPELYRLMFGDRLTRLREQSCQMQEYDQGSAFDVLIALVEDAQKENLFSHTDPIEQATAIWALIHGQATLLIDGHPMISEQKDKLIRIGVTMILKGLQ